MVERSSAVLSGTDPQKEEKSFHYRALDPSKREIRLLKLLRPRLPGAKKKQESNLGDIKVRCELQHASLDDKPKYTALSYAWGDPTVTVPVILDNCLVHVTENLESGLRQLQASETGALWVDALCINQKDDVEKSSQVQMMGSIYKHAIKVVVWLGPEQDDSGLGMSVIRDMGILRMKSPAFGLYTRPLEDGVFKASMERLCGNATSVLAIYHILDRAWWKRLWVLQEIALAENAIIICGIHTVSWQELSAALELIIILIVVELGSTNKDLNFAMSVLDSLNTIIRNVGPLVVLWREFQRSEGKGLNLKTVFQYASRLQCTDPRDRIFGFFGLLNDGEQQKISVDYSKSYSEVFTQAIKALLEDYGPDILSLCQNRCSFAEDDLPSWVPDWRNEMHIPLHRNRNMVFAASGPLGNHFSSIKVFNGTKNLALPGVFVDVVYKTGSAIDTFSMLWGSPERPEEALNAIRNVMTEMGEMLPEKHSYRSPGALREALHRTPIADTGINGKRVQISDVLAREAFYKVLDQGKEEDQRSWQWELQVKDYVLSMNIHGRCAFSTSKGFLGLGPEHAQPDDVVCIFLGGQMPYVLRHGKDGKHQLVGEAYVHGIMDGEFMEQNPKVEEIELY